MDKQHEQEILAAARTAMETFPWYQHLCGTKESLTIAQLPLMTRAILDSHYYETAESVDPSDTVFTTSGTASGQRRRIAWSASEVDINNRMKRRLFGDHLGPWTRVVIDVGLGLAASSAKQVFNMLDTTCIEISYHRPAEEHIERIREFQAEALYSMPSLVDGLLRAGLSDSWPIHKLILVGEICSDAWRERTASVLGISQSDILDTYGCVETGLIAYRCNHCLRFHFSEGVIPEVVPLSAVMPTWSDDALRPGEAVLVVTSRYRQRMPIVRYVTYDIIRNFGEAPCGENPALLGFDTILGRVGDEVKHGERISLHDIERAVLSIAPLARYQVLLSSDGTITLEVLSEDISDTQIDALSTALAASVPVIDAMVKAQLIRPIVVRRVLTLRSTVPGSVAKKSVVRI